MKVLISDYPDSMMPTHDLEAQTLKAGLGEDLEIEVFPYADDARQEFLRRLESADALLTAFIPMDAGAFEHAPNLKVISLNATGYDNVDLEEATRRGVGVCPVGEYCTWDVSEAALAMMFALNKNLKLYQRLIDVDHKWDYAAAPATPRIEDQTLGIVGFGKIGSCTARKASGLVKRILANDIIDRGVERYAKNGATSASIEQILEESDIIVNHMNLNDTNHHFFDAAKFAAMKKKPIFINLGRGLCVDESALIEALDQSQIRAFGGDVLYDETPDLANHPLVGRDNVLITPHAAFYSTSSLRDMQVYSCNNIVNFICGREDDLFKLVNDVDVKDVR